MSFLDGIVSAGKSVGNFLSGDSFGASLVKTAALAFAVNKFSSNANKANRSGTRNIDKGVRLQLTPDTQAKIPVLYGDAYFGGNLFDAKMSADNKTMFFAMALSEKTGIKLSDASPTTYIFEDIYLDNQRIVFKADGITADYAVDASGTIDRSISGLITVYCYGGNGSSGQVPANYVGTVPNAYDIFPDWTLTTHPADDLVFAIIRINYNRDKNVTGLGDFLFRVKSDMTNPGDVIYDYLTDARYGVGIPAAEVDTASLNTLATYSDSTVAYNDEGTGAQTLPNRYQINGLVDTDENVLDNAENLCSAAASWLTYDTRNGSWGVVINKPESSIASFSDDNVLDTVSLGGTGLTDLYNAVKVEFPHRDIKDSGDFVKLEIDPADRNANEPDNTLVITYDNINEPVQAELLGFIELKQSRIDKIVDFQVDYSYVGLQAGDVIDLTNSRLNFVSKLFRIITVTEVQDQEGALRIQISAMEYDADVYSVIDITRFIRSDEDGIITIGSIGQPPIPQVTKTELASRPRILVESVAPTGVVEAMEFWLSYDVNQAEVDRSYTLLSTKRPLVDGPYASGDAVDIEVDSLSAGEFVIKARGINDITTGPFSDPSVTVVYAPKQQTDAIGPETEALDSLGGLATALGVLKLLNNLDTLFGGDATTGLFDKIFQVFEQETGTDLVATFSGTDPSYILRASAGTVQEGSSVNITLTTVNVADNTVVPYTITGVSASDFVASNLTGNFIVINNTATITLNPSDDGIEEGTETLTLTLDGITPVVSTNVTITDAVPSYSLSTTAPSVTEGESFTITLTTQNVPDSTQVPYTITGVTSDNIDGAALTGVFTVTGGVATQQFVSSVDENTEDETFIISLDNQPESIQVVIAEPNELGNFVFLPEDRPTRSNPLDESTPNLVPIDGSYFFKLSGTFFGPLTVGTGNVRLYKSDGALVETVSAASLIINGNVVEIPFAQRARGTDYYILMDAGVVAYCDVTSAAISQPTVWNFNTPNYITDAYTGLTPDAAETFPDNLAVQTSSIGSGLCPTDINITLTFNYNVTKSTGNVNVLDTGDDSVVATLSIDTAVVTGNSVNFGNVNLDYDKSYVVEVDAGIVNATVGDTCYSQVISSAAATDITLSTTFELAYNRFIIDSGPYFEGDTTRSNLQSNVAIEFNRSVSFGSTGSIYIYDSSDVLFQQFDVTTSFENNLTSELIWIEGDQVYLNTTTDFTTGESYYVQVDAGAIESTCDVWPGVNDKTTIAFTIDEVEVKTAPVSNGSDVSFELDREMVAGTGNILVYDDQGVLIATIPATDPAVTIG